MSELIDLKKLIQHGAPANGDEARQIIRVAMENAEGSAEEWEKRLSAALTEILVGRQLHTETYAARAQALAILAEIEKRTPAIPEPGRPHSTSREKGFTRRAVGS